MRRIDQRILGQREQFVMHAAVQSRRIAILKIGAAATVNQQGIASQHAAIHGIGKMIVGVAWGMQRCERDAPNAERPAVLQRDIGAGQLIQRRMGNAAAGLLLELARRRDMVGMDMRIHGVSQLEPKRVDLGQIALPGRQYRVYQNGLPGLLATEQIGIGAGNRFKQLPENHVASSIRY